MSEEIKTTDLHNEKITSAVKTKDPRRVEAGKRLGMISKQAKEKKLAQMRERLQDEQEVKQNKASVSETSDWFSNTLVSSPVVSIGFVGLVGLVLYYGYNRVAGYNKKYKTVSERSDDDSQYELSKSASHVKTEEATSKTKPKRVYKELDTLD